MLADAGIFYMMAKLCSFYSGLDMIPIRSIAVSAVLLSECQGEFKLLLMKRVKGDFWSHISGHIEHNESASQTVMREIFEETGIRVVELYSADYLEQFYEPNFNVIETVPVFMGYCMPNQPVVLNDEHCDYGWFTLEEACIKAEFSGQRLLYRHIWENFVQRQPSVHLKIKK